MWKGRQNPSVIFANRHTIAIMDSPTAHYEEEERRLMTKVKNRQRSLMEADVRLSPEAALSAAIRAMPNTYNKYVQTRAILARLGVHPIQLKDL